MKKQDVKNILISMRTEQNDTLITNLLGKLDMMDDLSFQTALEKVSDDEESVKDFFKHKLIVSHPTHNHKYPINDMFTYGISGNCIHLHLPGDFREIVANKGISYTMDTVNLHLLDALDKIKSLRDNGFYRFQGKDSIYMISPILIRGELQFLEELGFKTKSYRKKDLNNDEFLKEHTEAKLAVSIFGKDRKVGSALITFDTISSKEWQDKKKQKVMELTEKGISLHESSQVK